MPAALAALGLAASAHATDILPAALPSVEISATDQPPVIDGALDDAAWSTAPIISAFSQVEPSEGAAPSERTEVRVMYDADALYVAFTCFDSSPDEIIATQMQRDGDLDADDHVRFLIDPFLDRRNGFVFAMNAVGARFDALIEDQTSVIDDWDGIWFGRSRLTADGWTAEFSIPFKTLSFDPGADRWGFNAERFIRRRNEEIRWASPSRDQPFTAPAEAGTIDGIRDIRQGIGLDVKPFSVATVKRNHADDTSGIDVDAGLDLFYKFTPQLTLALTINTDFAETEVDERRVNLTRFPLFFPEKRDFFLQDAGIFAFGGIRRNPLPFQSRRIGLGPDGSVRDILAGVKLTGRVGALNLGLLDVQMQYDEELGNKNLFVGRATVNVLDESTVGAIFTYGSPNTPGENAVAGVDFNFRTSKHDGDKVVDGSAFFLRSDATDVAQASAFGFKVGYPNDRVSWNLGFTQIDEDFEAHLGFVPRRGIREYFAQYQYRWRPTSAFIRTIDTGFFAQVVTDLEDHVESRELSINLLDIGTHAGDSFFAGLDLDREVLTSPFEISDGIVIPPGDYRFGRYSLGVFTSEGRPVGFDASYSGGEFYSGTRDRYEVGAEWRVSRHLNLGAEFQMNDVRLPEGRFITRLVQGRVNIFFTPDLSWNTFVQYDNGSESIGVNSRVRWIVKPGNEIFFVLNQAIDRDDRSFRVRETSLTTKIGWTFRF